jgi:hypothetical protein
MKQPKKCKDCVHSETNARFHYSTVIWKHLCKIGKKPSKCDSKAVLKPQGDGK